MAKAEIKTVEKKINIKLVGGVYEALQGGDSAAMLLHLTGGDDNFDEYDLDHFTKQAALHGWKLVVR